jgi:phage N-6-adenine-methyltransferase
MADIGVMLTPGGASVGDKGWETPPELFRDLDEEFAFDLDPCCVPETAKCPRYFTPEDDGLSRAWAGMVYMNPPYGREILAWVRKAHEEAISGRAVVVALLPARTDTGWFHDYCLPHEIRFIRKRVRFVGGVSYAPFPSIIVVFRGGVRHAVSRAGCPQLTLEFGS